MQYLTPMYEGALESFVNLNVKSCEINFSHKFSSIETSVKWMRLQWLSCPFSGVSSIFCFLLQSAILRLDSALLIFHHNIFQNFFYVWGIYVSFLLFLFFLGLVTYPKSQVKLYLFSQSFIQFHKHQFY